MQSYYLEIIEEKKIFFIFLDFLKEMLEEAFSYFYFQLPQL